MAEKLILIGGGGHAKSCIDVIELENKFEIIGVLDVKSRLGEKVLGYEIIGTDEDIDKYVAQGFWFLVTVGQIESAKIRTKIFEKLEEKGAKIATVVSPLSHVSRHSEIGEGSIIMHQSLVNAGAKVGKNCIINSKALLEHDVQVENYSHISTAAVLNGDVVVGEETFVGSNATIVNGAKITSGSFIKAGSLVK